MTAARAARGVAALALLGLGGFGLYEAVEAPRSGAIAGTIAAAPPDAARAPRVALTFDDGPDPATTPALLAALRARRAPATFFVVGTAARRHPDLVRAERALGAEIEDHTATHAHLDLLAPEAARREIDEGIAAVVAAGAPRPRFLRPPYGRRSAAVIAAAHAAGLRVVTWSVDALGTPAAPRDPAALAGALAARAGDGAIVLLHDGARGRDGGGERAWEARLAPALVDALRARGVRLVRLDALLAHA